MKYSIYSSLYHLKNFDIDYKFILKNWYEFSRGDSEIVIAVNNEPEEADEFTIEEMAKLADKYSNLRIIQTGFSYNDNEFDGKIKNAALKTCDDRFPIKIQMDFDECFPFNYRETFDHYAERLLYSPYDAMFIPSLDLYGDEKHIRKNHNIGLKWRLHKNGLKRGVWPAAKLPGGLISTDKSDTCELLYPSGELVQAICPISHDKLIPQYCHDLPIYTLHLGYLSLERRKILNKTWWRPKWEERSNKKENVIISLKKLKEEETIEHHLDLW